MQIVKDNMMPAYAQASFLRKVNFTVNKATCISMERVKSRHWLIILAISSLFVSPVSADIIITASWYSIGSLKQEGTWKYSKGVMANGQKFNNDLLCCANRLYPLGTMLRVTNLESGKTVIVETTDRIGKCFAKTRIDLSKRAFAEIADLEQGIVPVKVEVIEKGGERNG